MPALRGPERGTMKRLLIVFALAFAACGGGESKNAAAPAAKPKTPPPPTPAAAKELIAYSPDFSEYQFTNAAYTLPMKKSAMNEPARQAAKELFAAGWIRFVGDDVQLNEKSGGDRRLIIRLNGYVDLVPLARKEFGEVTAVRGQADGAVLVDFGWRWIPNEIGQAFKSGLVKERFDAPQRATAKLMWDGKTWTILRIDEVK